MSQDRPPERSDSVISQEQAAMTMHPMGMPPQDVSPPSQGGDGPPRMPGQPDGFPPGYTGYGAPAYHHSQYPPQGGFPGYGGQGYPPYGYPPPHMYPGYAPPPYGYGYPGYPSQQQAHSAEKAQEKARRRSPQRSRAKSSPARGRAEMPVDVELERQRAVYESVSVKPMRTSFHFFVDDTQDKLRGMAEEEVRRSTGDSDPFLVNTNLNGRLMKLWEDSEASVREAYTKKEDADRHRFMADDEVASRHCATLTARARSPRVGEKQIGEKKTSKEESESEGDKKKEDDDRKRLSPTENGESQTKKSRVKDADLE